MKYLLLTLSLMITNTYAFTSDDMLHPMAHAGSAYIITHMGEVVCHKVTNLNKTVCSVIAGSVAMSLGAAVEIEQNAGGSDAKRGLLEDFTGVGLAIGIIHMDF